VDLQRSETDFRVKKPQKVSKDQHTTPARNSSISSSIVLSISSSIPPETGKGTQACSVPTRGNLKHSLFGLSQPKSKYFTPPWGPEIFACGNLNSINEHISRGHRFTRLRPRICRPSGALTSGCSSHQRTVASAHRKSSYAREGHHVLSQLFDWQRFIYHHVYCSNGSW